MNFHFLFVATDVVTVYVFQEPSLLSSLQDSGLTDVVLHALLIKDVSSTPHVLALREGNKNTVYYLCFTKI